MPISARGERQTVLRHDVDLARIEHDVVVGRRRRLHFTKNSVVSRPADCLGHVARPLKPLLPVARALVAIADAGDTGLAQRLRRAHLSLMSRAGVAAQALLHGVVEAFAGRLRCLAHVRHQAIERVEMLRLLRERLVPIEHLLGLGPVVQFVGARTDDAAALQ
jgi:hypothetical protein